MITLKVVIIWLSDIFRNHKHPSLRVVQGKPTQYQEFGFYKKLMGHLQTSTYSEEKRYQDMYQASICVWYKATVISRATSEK